MIGILKSLGDTAPDVKTVVIRFHSDRTPPIGAEVTLDGFEGTFVVDHIITESRDVSAHN